MTLSSNTVQRLVSVCPVLQPETSVSWPKYPCQFQLILEIYEDIRTALFQDNATAGEAAGYAMGLIMLGTASERALEEMLSYARETQHEKIIRSLAVGIALVMYGTRELADGIIDELMKEKVSAAGEP